MRLTHTNRHFSSCAIYVLGALLCLYFSFGAHSDTLSKSSTRVGLSSPYTPETESTGYPHRGLAKPAVAPQFTIRGAIRDKHSPPHPANLLSERYSALSLSSSYSPLNNLADVRSLIFLSPLQDRAPPRFA
jgi:hypothetical protein